MIGPRIVYCYDTCELLTLDEYKTLEDGIYEWYCKEIGVKIDSEDLGTPDECPYLNNEGL